MEGLTVYSKYIEVYELLRLSPDHTFRQVKTEELQEYVRTQ
jgi:hypothetical protein